MLNRSLFTLILLNALFLEGTYWPQLFFIDLHAKWRFDTSKCKSPQIELNELLHILTPIYPENSMKPCLFHIKPLQCDIALCEMERVITDCILVIAWHGPYTDETLQVWRQSRHSRTVGDRYGKSLNGNKHTALLAPT